MIVTEEYKEIAKKLRLGDERRVVDRLIGDLVSFDDDDDFIAWGQKVNLITAPFSKESIDRLWSRSKVKAFYPNVSDRAIEIVSSEAQSIRRFSGETGSSNTSSCITHSLDYGETSKRFIEEILNGNVLFFKKSLHYYSVEEENWRVYDKEERILSSQIREYVRMPRKRGELEKLCSPTNKEVTEIIDAIIDFAASKERPTSYDCWLSPGLNSSNDFIRMQNGILNIHTKELLPHSPDYFSLVKLGIAYEPEKLCPEWLKFLSSLEWTEESIAALQVALGYYLSSDDSQQKLIVFSGHSRGGKGTICRVLEQLFGQGNIFTSKFNEAGRDFGLQNLPGKKLWLIHEAHKGKGERADRAIETIKAITGNDPTTIERKHKANLEAVSINAKVVMLFNELPQFVDSSGAFFNRVILFQFIKSFHGKEDRSLSGKLFAELSGIFNWMLRGFSSYQETQELLQPSQFAGYLESFRESTNLIEYFVREFLRIQDEDETVSMSDFVLIEVLYMRYKDCAQTLGKTPRNRQRFVTDLKSHLGSRAEHVKQMRIGGNRTAVFKGLKLKKGDLMGE